MSDKPSPALAAVWKCSDALAEYVECVAIAHDAMREYIDAQDRETDPANDDVIGSLSVARLARQDLIDAWDKAGMTFAAAFFEICKIRHHVDIPAAAHDTGTSHHHAAMHAYTTLHGRMQWLIIYQGANLINIWGHPEDDEVEGLKITIRRKDFEAITLPELEHGKLNLERAQAALIADSREWPRFVHPDHFRDHFRVSAKKKSPTPSAVQQRRQRDSFVTAIYKQLAAGVRDNTQLRELTGATPETVRWAKWRWFKDNPQMPRKVGA